MWRSPIVSKNEAEIVEPLAYSSRLNNARARIVKYFPVSGKYGREYRHQKKWYFWKLSLTRMGNRYIEWFNHSQINDKNMNTECQSATPRMHTGYARASWNPSTGVKNGHEKHLPFCRMLDPLPIKKKNSQNFGSRLLLRRSLLLVILEQADPLIIIFWFLLDGY